MELTLSSEVVHVPLAGLRELGFPPRDHFTVGVYD